MKKYQLLNPSDARIFINFKDKENPVRFEYPIKHHPFNLLFLFFLKLTLIATGIIAVPLVIVILILGIAGILDISILFLVGLAIIYFFILFMTPFVITRIFLSSEKLMAKVPKIQMRWHGYLGEMGYVYINKLDSNVYELPVFKNVYIEYDSKRDFAKIVKIEIEEYKFKWVSCDFKGRIMDKEQQTKYWKVRFIYDEIPKRGNLSIKFI